jgi:hypothetical protein
LAVALPYLPTFRKLNVGLWGFNEVTGAITTALTPRPRLPAGRGHRAKAITRVLGTAKHGPPSYREAVGVS